MKPTFPQGFRKTLGRGADWGTRGRRIFTPFAKQRPYSLDARGVAWCNVSSFDGAEK